MYIHICLYPRIRERLSSIFIFLNLYYLDNVPTTVNVYTDRNYINFALSYHNYYS